MAGHTTIANGMTGLAVRTILNNELVELFGENAKSCISVSDVTARNAIPAEYLAAGKLVYCRSDNTIYEYDGVSAWTPTSLVINDISVQFYDFDTTPTVTMREGRMAWDADNGTAMIGMPGGNVNLQLGQEMHIRAKNAETTTITNGTVVYASGASGQKPTIKRASATTHELAILTVGLATEDITSNQFGYVTTYGIVNNVNTNGMIEGGLLWLSETSGQYTQTRPTQPATGITIGTVLYAHSTQGKIFVKPAIVFNLSGLSDVGISSPSDGDLVYWDNTDGVWKARGPQFGDVTGGNYSEFEADGTLVFNGDATVWNDENFNATATAVGSSAPSLISWDTTSILIPSFPSNLTKELNMLKEFPHSGKSGSTITFHAHVMPTTAAAGTIKFYLEYYIKLDNLSAVTNTVSASVSTTSTAWEEIRLDFPAITSALFQPGAQIGARLYRLSTDAGTYAAPVAISTWGYHYEADTVGSRTISSK